MKTSHEIFQLTEQPTMEEISETREPLESAIAPAWLAVSFGGGTNSTAMLCGMRDRGIRPDVIIFADTGGELPHTYEHVALMAAQVQVWWGLTLHTVTMTRQGKPITLEQDCLNKGLLPSISYGRRSCSQRSKHEPMEKLLVKLAKAAGVTEIRKAIGYDAGERGRGRNAPVSAKLSKCIRETYWYPLREWGWSRTECTEAIERHGITQPGKSSCFFCAANKRSEVIRMQEEHPRHLARALAMEEKAQARHRSLIGLGGQRNLWANWLSNEASQGKFTLDLEPVHLPCGCYDG
jgi:3'-phosphoadenosine 5'-phosphosulfate sulfotransferase (PAPS reductase)/FAD synthetase